MGNKYQLILGSQSPRRQELLKAIFIPFKIRPSKIEEISYEKKPYAIVEDLAAQKAQAVFSDSKEDNPLVIGSDTIVVFQNEILGKPANVEEAKKTLEKLSGNTHEVLTGVSLKSKNQVKNFHVKTEVSFREISEDLMEFYLQTGESLDKAGAYGIQEHSFGFIGEIKGSYSNVVGLPVDSLLIQLKNFVEQEQGKDISWRELFE